MEEGKKSGEDLNLSNHHQRTDLDREASLARAIDCGRTQQLTSQLINLFSLYLIHNNKTSTTSVPRPDDQKEPSSSERTREWIISKSAVVLFRWNFRRLLIRQQRQLAICSILFLHESETTDKILCYFFGERKTLWFFFRLLVEWWWWCRWAFFSRQQYGRARKSEVQSRLRQARPSEIAISRPNVSPNKQRLSSARSNNNKIEENTTRRKKYRKSIKGRERDTQENANNNWIGQIEKR